MLAVIIYAMTMFFAISFPIIMLRRRGQKQEQVPVTLPCRCCEQHSYYAVCNTQQLCGPCHDLIFRELDQLTLPIDERFKQLELT